MRRIANHSRKKFDSRSPSSLDCDLLMVAHGRGNEKKNVYQLTGVRDICCRANAYVSRISVSLPSKKKFRQLETFASMCSRMDFTAADMLTIAYGVVSLLFLTFPSIHDFVKRSWGMGTNFLTDNSKGTGQTSDWIVIVLTCESAHFEMSFNFITGHRKVNSNPGAFPVR